MTIATKEQVKIYKMIEAKVNVLDDEVFTKVIEEVSNYVFSWGQVRKQAYNKCRKWAKKFDCSVPDLETWYSVEEF